jgi:hypothetical protein
VEADCSKTTAVDHQIDVTGDDDALIAPNFERIEAQRSWHCAHTLRIFLKAQQIDDTKFLPRIQSRLQQLGMDLQHGAYSFIFSSLFIWKMVLYGTSN